MLLARPRRCPEKNGEKGVTWKREAGHVAHTQAGVTGKGLQRASKGAVMCVGCEQQNQRGSELGTTPV